MISEFYISGSDVQRPPIQKTIFADGSADESFRPDIDLELSHWVPNTTPEKYKADTSTEICIKYVSNPDAKDWELVVNNHQDVDGILSVFSLVHSQIAIENQTVIVEASKMGDFWAWGSLDAQRLFQGLTLKMNQVSQQGAVPQEIYSRCFAFIIKLLEGSTQLDVSIDEGIACLNQSLKLVDEKQIKRKVYHKYFAHYHIPPELVETPKELKRARRIQSFNEPLSNKTMLMAQVRNKFDPQKVQLISIETSQGIYYDLHYPGYSWAETPDSWRAPGLELTGSTNVYYFGHEPLSEAIERLNSKETGNGKWMAIKSLTPFTTSLKKKYPVVVSFLLERSEGHYQSVPSQIPVDEVGLILSSAFNV